MQIHFHSILPLYKEEMDLKLKKGAEELFDRFDANQVSELLNLKRQNLAKKFFGLF